MIQNSCECNMGVFSLQSCCNQCVWLALNYSKHSSIWRCWRQWFWSIPRQVLLWHILTSQIGTFYVHCYISGGNQQVSAGSTCTQFLCWFLLLHPFSIRYPPFSENKVSDIQTIQSSDAGRFSRLLHLAQMLTKSASGYAPYHRELPNLRKDAQECETEDESS